MKKPLLLTLLTCFCLFSYGQTDVRSRGSGTGTDQPAQPQQGQKRYSGRILDQNGQPVVGATISVIDAAGKTVAGTYTDADGNYSVSAAAGLKLKVSSVSYTTTETILGDSETLNYTLQEESSLMEEVVVVGYGTSVRRDLTSSVSTIKGDDIKSLPSASAEQLMQGRAPGVQITTASGTPGAGVSVLIRGVSSLSASTQPLYVVDGIPIGNSSFAQTGVGGQNLNPLSDINPNDIESLEILKDASAAAIFGARAANGVVLITTKRGKQGKVKFTVDSYYGFQQAWKRPQMLNGQQYVELRAEAFRNSNPTVPANDPRNDPNSYYLQPFALDANPNQAGNQTSGLAQFPAGLPGQSTDWVSEIFQTAPVMNYDISASGGSDKITYRFGGGFYRQDGTIKGTGFERLSTRFNLDAKDNGWVTGFSIQLSSAQNYRQNNDNNIFGVLSTAILNPTNFPAYNPDGSYFLGGWNNQFVNPANITTSVSAPTQVGTENVIASYTESKRFARNNRIIGSGYIGREIVKGLSWRSTIGIDFLNLKEDNFLPSTLAQGSPQGQAASYVTTDITWISQNNITYQNVFASAHDVNVLVGFDAQRTSTEATGATGSNFPTNEFQRIASAALFTSAAFGNPFSTGTFASLVSFYGRANYNYKGRYYASFTVRTDGSSRFGQSNRYATFPSMAAAWRITEEEFIKNLNLPVLSSAKFRASYGQIGNQNFGILSPDNFPSLGLFGGGGNYNDQPGIFPNQLANPNLRWESTTQLDIALDFGLFKERLSGTIEYFNKETNNLLQTRQLPLTSGFGGVVDNVGRMRNTGWEFQLNSVNLDGQIKWTTNFNISWITNRVVQLFQDAPFDVGFASRVEVGHPIGTFFGYEAAGVHQGPGPLTGAGFNGYSIQPGDMLYTDLNGDGTITTADRKVLGNAQPNYFGGITNTISYKGIEFSFFIYFQGGNKIYNNTLNFGENLGSLQFNNLASALGRWSPTNPSLTVPRALASGAGTTHNRLASSRYLEDGSFVRLRNVTLAYNLKPEWCKVAGLNSVRVYFTGQNLLTFTRYSGLDPEVSTLNGGNTTAGTDFLTFPIPRTYIFGLTVGF